MTELPTKLTAWTIGHSRHEFDVFANLLGNYDIDVVVDVRSVPMSRMAPQFNQVSLKKSLASVGVDYVFMGPELGGRPDDDEMYDEKGFVLYNRVAESKLFLEGMQRLHQGLANHRVAIMCSEGSPEGCHRHLLIGRVLASEGVEVVNILNDGSSLSYTEMVGDYRQGVFFELDGCEPWKSALSVRPAAAQKTSFPH